MKNLVNIKDVKVLVVAVVSSLSLSACKVYYENTFVSTKDNKMLVTDNETGEERLIDCAKSKDSKQLLSDLPYFKAGDPVKVRPAKRYNGFRVFSGTEAAVKYNADTIQIRKDKEVIQNWKNGR